MAQSTIHPSGDGGSGASTYPNCHESSLSWRERSEHLPCVYRLYRLTLEDAHRGRPRAQISTQTVHSAQSSRMGWRGRFIIIRQGGTRNSRKRMTQRNSYTAWVGSERLNSEPNSTVLRRIWMRSLPELWKPPGPGHCAYSTGATQGRWTNAITTLPR